MEGGARVLHVTPGTGGYRVYNVNRRRAGPAMAVIDKTAEQPVNTNLPCIEHPEGNRSLSLTDRIFMTHQGGKIHVAGNFQIESPDTLAMAYTPGVGRVCQAIAADPALAYRLTGKGNSVAVVTDGSAVLGLGNLGPQSRASRHGRQGHALPATGRGSTPGPFASIRRTLTRSCAS